MNEDAIKLLKGLSFIWKLSWTIVAGCSIYNIGGVWWMLLFVSMGVILPARYFTE